MRRAFTLIELLVVIAIITVLIAILLPVLKNARYSVLVDICKSNLHQVGVGVLAYTVDNDGYYPNGYISGPTTWRSNTGNAWQVYVKKNTPTGVDQHDMVDILADYYGGVDGMRDAYMCSFMQEGYERTMTRTDKLWYSTNAGQQPFALLWNLQGGGAWGIKQGMFRHGERWQQGSNSRNGYGNMWYNVLAGDVISPNQYGGGRANHWNFGNATPFKETTGSGGFELAPGEPTNGNFLLDDGSVSNHNNMQMNEPHVGGTGGLLIPAEYATNNP